MGGICDGQFSPYKAGRGQLNAMIRLRSCTVLCSCFLLSALVCAGQSAKNQAGDVASSVQRGLDLATKGRCKEALPQLKNRVARLSDKQLKYRAAMATARCAM